MMSVANRDSDERGCGGRPRAPTIVLLLRMPAVRAAHGTDVIGVAVGDVHRLIALRVAAFARHIVVPGHAR